MTEPDQTFDERLIAEDFVFRKQARGLLQDARGDAELVDLASFFKGVESFCGEQRRLIEAELPDDGRGRVEVAGTAVTAKAGGKAKRSYNVAAIITDTQAEGLSILDLVDADALRLTFQWTKLKKVLAACGITLRVAPHELGAEEGDLEPAGPHVGEVWTTGSFRYPPKGE